MALRIGFDLDGVLADMESELVRQAEALFGEVMTRRLQERAAGGTHPAAATVTADAPGETGAQSPDPIDNTPPLLKLNMTPRQQRKLWRHVETIENFWQTLDEIEPGIVKTLAEMAAERRWEIIFLTKRPRTAGFTAQRQTQHWLQSKGFPLPSVFVVQGSRGRIASAFDLDLVVDDRPENCLDVVVDSTARAILIWRDDERLLPASMRRLGIGVVNTTEECLHILAEVDATANATEQPGMMDRMKRFLGRKQPTSV
jgi:hypothetical protein